MIRVEGSTLIDRPPTDVYAFTADVRNLSMWVPQVIEAKQTTDGPLEAGARFTDVIQFLGRRFETHFEVTEVVPERNITFKSTSGPFPIEVTQRLGPEGAGTRLTMVMESSPGGFFKVAEPVLPRVIQRQLDTALGNVKDLLET
ncbi:MAG: SRPBCC family protein [Actinomycetota bacterium]